MKLKENISIAQGLINDSLDDSKCYELIQDSPFEKNIFKKESQIFFNTKILNNSGETINIRSKENYIIFSDNKLNNLENILMENKI